MSIRYQVYKHAPGREKIDIPVSVNGMTITVHKSSFLLRGETYELLEDEEVDITELLSDLEPDSEGALVTGWVVLDKENDEVRLLIDAMEAGLDGMYSFDNDPAHTKLHELFYVGVTPDMTSLDDADICVMKVEETDG